MKNTKTTIKQPRSYANVLGMLQVFVLASIGYTSYLTIVGTTGIAPKIMAAPQMLFGAILLVTKFVRK